MESHSVAFAIHPKDFRLNGWNLVKGCKTEGMNEVVVSCSDRFVYSKTKSQEISNMVDTIGGWSVPGKTAFIGEMPGTEKIEEHLRKTMGIKRRAAAASGGEDLRKN
jgi:hypothetical protein